MVTDNKCWKWCRRIVCTRWILVNMSLHLVAPYNQNYGLLFSIISRFSIECIYLGKFVLIHSLFERNPNHGNNHFDESLVCYPSGYIFVIVAWSSLSPIVTWVIHGTHYMLQALISMFLPSVDGNNILFVLTTGLMWVVHVHNIS